MSLTGGLVPLGGGRSSGKGATTSSKLTDEDFDDDDFDAMFNDMLDAPTPKSTGKGGKKGGGSKGGGGASSKKKKFDMEGSLESFASPASSTFSPDVPSGAVRQRSNSPDDVSDADVGGLLGGSSDNLEDSILGRLTGTKSGGGGAAPSSSAAATKASKPDSVPSTAARTAGTVHNARSIDPAPAPAASRTGGGFVAPKDKDDDFVDDFDDIDLPDLGGYQPSAASNSNSNSNSSGGGPSPRPPSSSPPSSSVGKKGPAPGGASDEGRPAFGAPRDDTRDKGSNSSSSGAGGDSELGFIPSFYEPGRQTRQRRILGTAPGPGGGGPARGGGLGQLDELDAALGLGGAAGTQRKVSDPFASTGGGGFKPRGVPVPTPFADSSDSDDAKPAAPAAAPSSSSSSSSSTRTSVTGTGGAAKAEAATSALPPVVPKARVDETSSAPGGGGGKDKEKEVAGKWAGGDDDLDVSGIVKKQAYEEVPEPAAAPSARLSISTASSSSSSSLNASQRRVNFEVPSAAVAAALSPSPSSGGHVPSGPASSPTAAAAPAASFSFTPTAAHTDPTPTPGTLPTSLSLPLRLSLPNSLSLPAFFHPKSHTSPNPFSGSSRRATITIGSLSPSDAAASMSKKELNKLQLSLEEAQLQKEAVERHLRLEIDSLKSRLQQQQSGGWEGGAGGVVALLEDLRGEHDRAMGRLREENHDLRKRAGQLEVEVSRLQDEGILAAAKHKEEVAYLQVPGPGPSPTRAPSPTELSRCSAYLRVAWAEPYLRRPPNIVHIPC